MISERVQLEVCGNESRGAYVFKNIQPDCSILIAIGIREYPTMAFTQALSIGSEVSCTTRLGKNVEGKVIALDEDHHVIVVRILFKHHSN